MRGKERRREWRERGEGGGAKGQSGRRAACQAGCASKADVAGSVGTLRGDRAVQLEPAVGDAVLLASGVDGLLQRKEYRQPQ